MLLASDSRRLEYAMTAQEMFFPAIQDIFDDGKGWVITPNQQILTMHILEAQPRIHNEEQKIFDWNVKFDILPEAKVFRKDTGQLHPIAEFDTRWLLRDGAIHGTLRSRFLNPGWDIHFIPEKEA